MRTAQQRAVALFGVSEQLGEQPTVATRNRKPMRRNPVAPWELRIGSLHVYYDGVLEGRLQRRPADLARPK